MRPPSRVGALSRLQAVDQEHSLPCCADTPQMTSTLQSAVLLTNGRSAAFVAIIIAPLLHGDGLAHAWPGVAAAAATATMALKLQYESRAQVCAVRQFYIIPPLGWCRRSGWGVDAACR